LSRATCIIGLFLGSEATGKRMRVDKEERFWILQAFQLSLALIFDHETLTVELL
jgi:hypothetical protein